MTLAWKAIGDDVILQEGTAAYNYQAGSTIKAGMALSVKESPMIVSGCKAKDSTNFVGIAAYDTSHDKYVAVYGPGNIVRVIISGATNCYVGDILIPSSDGKFQNRVVSTLPCASGIRAIALETKLLNNATAKVLLI